MRDQHCPTCLGMGTIEVVEQQAWQYATHDHGYELVAREEPCPECRGTGRRVNKSEYL